VRLLPRIALAASLLAALAGGAVAQKGSAAKDPLTASARGPAEVVEAGGLAEIGVTLTIAPTWHLYTHDFKGTGTPIDLSLAPQAGLTLESVQWPPPTVEMHDAVLDEDLRLLQGTVQFKALVRVSADRAPGPAAIVLRLKSQACTDAQCLLAEVRELPASFEVRAAAASAAKAAAPVAAAPKSFSSTTDPLSARVAAPKEAVPAGGLATLEITLSIDRPWHAYAHDFKGTGKPLDLSLAPEPGLTLESVDWPAPTVVRFDEILKEEQRLLEGSVTLKAHVRVAASRAPGPAHATLTLGYQTCTDSGCLVPTHAELAANFEVRAAVAGELAAAPAGPSMTAAPSEPQKTSLQDDFAQALNKGEVGRFLGLCVTLAFLSLLTPCVFPMIPITVSFFTKRGESGGGRGASYALAYGAGIVITYTGFGLGLAALLGAGSLQGFATNPWVNLAIGALFVFFGLSLMGLYDLRPPAFLARRAEVGVTQGGGYAPVLLMGFVFTVTAFTCTAPIVGTLLAALTAGGSLPLIVAGMFVYSVAFALPFVLLAMFPSVMSRLPGAGGWMITVKVVMGFIELVAALKFLSAADLVWNLQLLPRPSLLLLATLLMAALALYLFGAFRLPHDVPTPRRALSARTLFACAALLSALYFSRGLGGRTLDSWTESFLPPTGYGGATGATPELIAWGNDLAAGKLAAKAQGKLVFLDFTGVTCTNCRKVEKTIFVDRRFADALASKAVPVRLYTDRQSPEEVKAGDEANRKLMEQLGSVTLPRYVLMSPEGVALRSMGYDPSSGVQAFIDFLEVPHS
jgi:thiol:disulfide interchange protein DsbD